MTAITRDFPLTQLMDWDVPYSDDAIHTTSAWCVFQAPDDGLIYRIEQILGPRAHPDVAAIIDVVTNALTSQRRYIAREVRREAAAYQRGKLPSGNQQLTYDGGLRRAARIADASGVDR